FDIPLDHVVSVETGEQAAGATGGIDAVLSRVPAALAPRTFHQQSGRGLLAGHDPARALAIRLWNERYDRIVIDVDQPEMVVSAIVRAVRANPDDRQPVPSRTLQWSPNASAFGALS